MGKKHRAHEEESKDKRIKGQRARIKELEHEVKRLKGQLKTLNDAFRKSAEFMSDESKDLTVEQLIKAANDNHKLKQAKSEHKPKDVPVKSKEEIRAKWANWRANLTKDENDEN